MELVDLEALYRRYGPLVLRRATAILGDRQRGQDALQEVFVRALKADPTFEHDRDPIGWLYRMTTNYCLNHLRDERRRSELLQQNASSSEVTIALGPNERIALHRALDKVPAELREIAVYYYLDGMSHEEIAALVGTSRRTIGGRLEAFLAAVRAAGELEVQA